MKKIFHFLNWVFLFCSILGSLKALNAQQRTIHQNEHKLHSEPFQLKNIINHEKIHYKKPESFHMSQEALLALKTNPRMLNIKEILTQQELTVHPNDFHDSLQAPSLTLQQKGKHFLAKNRASPVLLALQQDEADDQGTPEQEEPEETADFDVDATEEESPIESGEAGNEDTSAENTLDETTSGENDEYDDQGADELEESTEASVDDEEDYSSTLDNEGSPSESNEIAENDSSNIDSGENEMDETEGTYESTEGNFGSTEGTFESNSGFQSTESYNSYEASPVEQSNTFGEQIDQVSNKIVNSVEQMRGDFGMANDQLVTTLQNDVHGSMDELKNNVQGSIGQLAHLVTAEASQTRSSIAQTANQLSNQIQQVSQKTDSNTAETIGLKIMLLEDELKEKRLELQQVQQQINDLQGKLPAQGADRCDIHGDCATCTQDARCGWCSSEKKCVQGDKVAPLYTTCNFYDYGQCSGTTCGRYRDCYSCLQDPFCGWCKNNDSSNGLCLEQPADFNGCTFNLWFHSQGSQNQCGLPQANHSLDDSTIFLQMRANSQLYPDEVQQQSVAEVQEDSNFRKMKDQLRQLMTQEQTLQAEINNLESEIQELRLRQAQLGLPPGTVTPNVAVKPITPTAPASTAPVQRTVAKNPETRVESKHNKKEETSEEANEIDEDNESSSETSNENYEAEEGEEEEEEGQTGDENGDEYNDENGDNEGEDEDVDEAEENLTAEDEDENIDNEEENGD